MGMREWHQQPSVAEMAQGYNEAGKAFRTAQRIIIRATTGWIGDTVIDTALIEGVVDALDRRESTYNYPFTSVDLVLNRDMSPLLAGIESDRVKVHFVEKDRHYEERELGDPDPISEGDIKTREIIETNSQEKILQIDLESKSLERSRMFQLHQERLGGKEITRLSNTLTFLLSSFPYTTEGGGSRFARAIQMLFQLKDSIDINRAQPSIYLPTLKEQREILNQLESRLHLPHRMLEESPNPRRRNSIAIVTEASAYKKRYHLSGWGEVMANIRKHFPHLELDWTYGDDPDGRKAADIRRIVEQYGLENSSNLVQASLLELAVLFGTERLIVGNDTGLIHIGTAKKHCGKARQPFSHIPPAVVAYSLGVRPERWQSSPQQHIVQVTEQDSYGEEDAGDVSYIPPKRILHAALQILYDQEDQWQGQ